MYILCKYRVIDVAGFLNCRSWLLNAGGSQADRFDSEQSERQAENTVAPVASMMAKANFSLVS